MCIFSYVGSFYAVSCMLLSSSLVSDRKCCSCQLHEKATMMTERVKTEKETALALLRCDTSAAA